MSDDLELLYLMQATPPATALAKLRAAGISNDVLGDPLVGPRYARIRTEPGELFELSDEGTAAVLLLPAVAAGRVVDLVAFQPATSSSALRLLGVAAALGTDLVVNPWRVAPPEPVRVVCDLLDWLRLAGKAVFVLDGPAFRDTVRATEQPPALIARDINHGRRLREILEPPAWAPPSILIPDNAFQARAA